MLTDTETPTPPLGRTQRISVSLPTELSEALDKMVIERGHPNRSQAICEMIRQKLDSHSQEDGDVVMAGTITLFYDASKRGLLQTLADIEREHIEEVISSQHVLLEGNHVMEVLLVQGPAKRLQGIRDNILNCKGIKTGELTVTRKIIPPIHARN